jgi:hypothetical protein
MRFKLGQPAPTAPVVVNASALVLRECADLRLETVILARIANTFTYVAGVLKKEPAFTVKILLHPGGRIGSSARTRQSLLSGKKFVFPKHPIGAGSQWSYLPVAFIGLQSSFQEVRRAFGRPTNCDGVAVQSQKHPCPMLSSLATDHLPPVSIPGCLIRGRSFLSLLPPFQRRKSLAALPNPNCLRPAEASCAD